ncbi:sulfite exporter TauE/SafE family protein [Breoghania sp.]|uniref:sulfite exporter TauE/SafE family protein n=1 Tax=Breoghania sp. TaxID=2065378 RepID=UPI002AA6899B|nr:sulfite exporter TauE/SafE family protein [Breoghania sp.]
MIDALLTALDNPALPFIVAAAVVAGAVRGFAGFGAAMIFMPVASVLIDPRLAAATFLVMDEIVALPLAVRAMRICDWRTVLPAVLAGLVTVPMGAAVLASGDTIALRWGISVLVLALLVLLVSGWRYSGRPNVPLSMGVGMTAGFLSGVSQVAGPPVVAFWMSSPLPAHIIRANLIVYFALASIGAFVAFWWNGFFTGEVIQFLIVLTPIYALALFSGTRAFRLAPETAFRRVAYTLVALAAVGSLPVLDGLLR